MEERKHSLNYFFLLCLVIATLRLSVPAGCTNSESRLVVVD